MYSFVSFSFSFIKLCMKKIIKNETVILALIPSEKSDFKANNWGWGQNLLFIHCN